MIKLNIRVVNLLVLILILPIACYGESKFSTPKRTPEEVVDHTQKLLSSKQVNREDYELSNLTYDYIKNNWYVGYSSKNLEIGGHFTFLIDDKDPKKTEFIPGL